MTEIWTEGIQKEHQIDPGSFEVSPTFVGFAIILSTVDFYFNISKWGFFQLNPYYIYTK